MASLHGPGGPRTGASPSVIFEVRRYQLKLGYDTVPTFLALLEEVKRKGKKTRDRALSPTEGGGRSTDGGG
jgi:hypothetical protein